MNSPQQFRFYLTVVKCQETYTEYLCYFLSLKKKKRNEGQIAPAKQQV